MRSLMLADCVVALAFYPALVCAESDEANEGAPEIELARNSARTGLKLKLDPPRWLTNLKHRMDAREELLSGDDRRAYTILSCRVLNGDDKTLEGFFLLALAAIQIGEERTLEKTEPTFAWSGDDLERIRQMLEAAKRSASKVREEQRSQVN